MHVNGSTESVKVSQFEFKLQYILSIYHNVYKILKKCTADYSTLGM